ncbi:uroporphyrinogen-III synthase [Solimicrobium silvestre]|uniref:Uroporphyrinogen-III synthase n=1 Tax=Solimicrobium silvestre TaxID=2099400 RepID=A0A2S9GU80_9BURK|nr:uroporphyrinogen-III synthase [Solimicrobium silvestre]PRC91268.1 Uroporphyrinogen-III synthase [Solimicrobium silvestre]
MASSNKIILTRPIAQAQPLAARLTALGYSVALFPLLEIAPLPEDGELHALLQATLANLSRYAMVAFVSPNAVHNVFQRGLKWPSEVAIAVVGEGSRAALAEYGINSDNTTIYCPTDPFRSDSETLLQELNLPALKGREVLILRAETGRELLSEALIAHGIQVVKVAAYRRFAPQITAHNSQLLLELLSCSDRWVVSSSEALRTLVELARKVAGEAAVVKTQQINLLVSHHRIAETAENMGFKCVRLIGSGDENLLLALQSHL